MAIIVFAGNVHALHSIPMEGLLQTPLGHCAAKEGHAECLQILSVLGAGALLTAVDHNGDTPAHAAADEGHVHCLQKLHDLGAGATFTVADNKGRKPAHFAGLKGRAECLQRLHDLGGGASLLSLDNKGRTPAHCATSGAHIACLQKLYDLGAGATMLAVDSEGRTPAHVAADGGHAGCLQKLYQLGAGETLTSLDKKGRNPAHVAANGGHSDCLQKLYDLGAASSLVSVDRTKGRSTAHWAAAGGYTDCLQKLHDLGAGASFARGDAAGGTPAHFAVAGGHADCLQKLHDLGAGASLASVDNKGRTPAHKAARLGKANCLYKLHKLLTITTAVELQACRSLNEPTSGKLPQPLASSAKDMEDALFAVTALATCSADGMTPAEHAAAAEEVECVYFIKQIGGAEKLLHTVLKTPELLDTKLRCLLTHPTLLNLCTKQAWLRRQLESLVSGTESLHLMHVGDHLKMDDKTEQFIDRVLPPALRVSSRGEQPISDGLRREWFHLTTKEILDPARGLFMTKDGCTLQPNPHSATAAGPNHLAYFALLGRVTGLALHHQEPLDAQWSDSFVKAVFEFPTSSVHIAELDHQRAMYLQSCNSSDLAALKLTFTDDCDEAIFFLPRSPAERHGQVELKPGGAEVAVTTNNLADYLQLFAQHRMQTMMEVAYEEEVNSSIQPQIEAFQNGLATFVRPETRATLRQCCTVAEIQVLMCGQCL